MRDGALALVCQKTLYHGFAKRMVGFTTLGAHGIAAGKIRRFELVILCRCSIELVDRRRLVVDRRRIDAATRRSVSIS